MSASGPKSLPAIGFLTVLEQSDVGLLGGYLVLNAAGRPLEFHCTAPVRSNRAQQILYGPTLAPYLYGEQIGQTLLGKAKIEPLLVCTDLEPALTVRQYVSIPVVLVQRSHLASRDGTPPLAERERYVEGPHSATPAPKSLRLVEFTLAGQTLAVPAAHGEDRQRVFDSWIPHAEDFDLWEPFSRIREALEEAQRGAK